MAEDLKKKSPQQEAIPEPAQPLPKKREEPGPEAKKPKSKKSAPQQPLGDDGKEKDKEKSGNAFVDAIVDQFSSPSLKGGLTGVLDKIKKLMRKQPDSKKPDPNSKVYQHSESRNEGKNDKTLAHAQNRAPDTGGPGQKEDVANRYDAARSPAASSAASAQPQQQANKTPTLKL